MNDDHSRQTVTASDKAKVDGALAQGEESTPGLPPPENKRFYPALDGLRAVAVMMVFFQHYLAFRRPALNWGWMGVDMFFVLSGFLITGILYDTRETEHRVRNFYMRRTLRIFPLYYGVLFGALITTPIFHWFWNRIWLLWFLYLGNYVRFLRVHSPLFPMGALEHLHAQPIIPGAFTLYLGHFWSLCVEEQFYLVWPMVVFAVRKRETLRTICLLSIPVVLAARIACVWLVPQDYLNAELLYRLTPLRADALLIGGLAALCLRGPEARWVLRWARPVALAFAASFAVWEGIYRLVSGTGSFYAPLLNAPVLTTIGYTLIDLFSAALILSILTIDNPVARFLNLGPLRRLGQISYGFYVFHDMFHDVYKWIVYKIDPAAQNPSTKIAVVAFIGTLLVATLSYRYFETPFLRLKARFSV